METGESVEKPTPYQIEIERRAVEFLHIKGAIDDHEAAYRLAEIDSPGWIPPRRYEVAPYDMRSSYPRSVADYAAVISDRSDPSIKLSTVINYYCDFDRFSEDLSPLLIDEVFGEGTWEQYQEGLHKIGAPHKRQMSWLGKLIKNFVN